MNKPPPNPPTPFQKTCCHHILQHKNVDYICIIQQIYNMNILWFSDIKWQLAVWLSDQWSPRECEDPCVLINKCRHALLIAQTCSSRNINRYFMTSKHLYKTIVIDLNITSFSFHMVTCGQIRPRVWDFVYINTYKISRIVSMTFNHGHIWMKDTLLPSKKKLSLPQNVT